MEEKFVDSQYQTKGYLCYLGILVLIPLLTVKKDVRDEFIDCHIKQGLGLLIFSIVIGIIFSFSPFIGRILYLVQFILMILGLVNVSKKKIAALPILGDFFAKLNF